MNRLNLILYTIILLSLFLPACYYDKENLLYGSVDCDTSEVSFSNHILPIVQASCATSGCHTQGGGGNGIFENYNQVKDKIDNNSFYDRVIVAQDMPPGEALNDCQILLIQTWLDQGAPNN